MKQLINKSILITGGTGSYGSALVRNMLEVFPALKRIIVFSRDEHKQYQMKQRFPQQKYPMLKFVLGDIRDRDALLNNSKGIDYIVHAAALKHNNESEANPDEFIKTNVEGTRNLLWAANLNNVSNIIAISTDKAVYPTTAYGASKLCAEKMLLAESESDNKRKIAILRLGNLLGSRASVVPYLTSLKGKKEINLTHPEMTRFSLSIPDSLQLTYLILEHMQGGEIFVPKMPAYCLGDLAASIVPKAKVVISGPRPAEKMHELAFTVEESRNAYEWDQCYILCRENSNSSDYWARTGTKITQPFEYSSDKTPYRLSIKALNDMIQSQPDS